MKTTKRFGCCFLLHVLFIARAQTIFNFFCAFFIFFSDFFIAQTLTHTKTNLNNNTKKKHPKKWGAFLNLSEF